MDGSARAGMDRRTTLEQLRSFTAVVDGGGFSMASAALGRTQSAVTQSLKKLEDAVGCRLLDRRQGHVTGLTPAGRRLLPQAREILARVSVAVETVRHQEIAGRVRLGVPDDVRVDAIQSALAGCLAMNPALDVEVQSAFSGEIAERYREGTLDVALFRQPAGSRPDPDAGIRLLRTEKLVWVAAAPLRFDRVGPLPLALYAEGCFYRVAVLGLLAAYGRTARLVYTTHSTDNLERAVLAGLGITATAADAVFDGAVVLGPEQGFPALPDAALMLAVRPGEEACRLLSKALIAACDLDRAPVGEEGGDGFRWIGPIT